MPAINFPDSPTSGQTFTSGIRTWAWDGVSWNLAIETPGYYVSDSAPENPSLGASWFNSSTGQTFIYYDGYWIEEGNGNNSPGPDGPTGPAGVVSAASPITYDSEAKSVGIDQSAISINVAQVATTVITKTSAYTILSSDKNTFIRSTSATAVNMTIDNVLNIGESVQFIQFGAGRITFVAGSGVNLRSVDNKLKTNKQYSVAAVTCIATGEYLVTGDLVA